MAYGLAYYGFASACLLVGLAWLLDGQILKDTNVAGVINNLPTLKL